MGKLQALDFKTRQGKLERDDYGRDHHPRCFSAWLAGAGIEALESPLPPAQIRAYQALKRQGAIPVFMDEGIVSPAEVAEFIALLIVGDDEEDIGTISGRFSPFIRSGDGDDPRQPRGDPTVSSRRAMTRAASTSSARIGPPQPVNASGDTTNSASPTA